MPLNTYTQTEAHAHAQTPHIQRSTFCQFHWLVKVKFEIDIDLQQRLHQMSCPILELRSRVKHIEREISMKFTQF